jgi:hypothetical protein
MQSLIESYKYSALTQATAKLGIADLLARGPRSSGDLAQNLGAHPESLDRFLKALVVVGICREEKDGRFSLTGFGTLLKGSKSGSLWNQAISANETYNAWGNLFHSIMTGETAIRHIHGTDVWDLRKQTAELDESFNKAFQAGTSRVAQELLSAYNFSSVNTVADIGGGYGSLLYTIIKASPSINGVLFDQPHVTAKAAINLEKTGVSNRIRVIGGDLFEHVPAVADLYILKSVIHDWNDEKSKRILTNVRNAMRKKSRLLLLERIMPARVQGKRNRQIVMLDLRMLLVTGGRERSEGDFRSLFHAAGLSLTRVIPLKSGYNIIEGIQKEPPIRQT